MQPQQPRCATRCSCGKARRCRSSTRWQRSRSLQPSLSQRSRSCRAPRHPQQSHSSRRCSPRCSRPQSSQQARRSSLQGSRCRTAAQTTRRRAHQSAVRMRCGTQARCRSTTRSQHTQSSRLAPCCSPRSTPHHRAPQHSQSSRRCSPRCSRRQSSRSERRSSHPRSSCPAASRQTPQASGPRRRVQLQRGTQRRCRCATSSRPPRCPRLDQQR